MHTGSDVTGGHHDADRLEVIWRMIRQRHPTTTIAWATLPDCARMVLVRQHDTLIVDPRLTVAEASRSLASTFGEPEPVRAP